MKPEIGVELLKLHGSVDWSIHSEGPTRENPIRHDVVVQVSQDQFSKTAYRPALVFGARSKLTAKGPFLDLLHTFRNRLGEQQELITIGYSGRDEHVNEVITRWLVGDRHRRLVVVDKSSSPEHLTELDRRYSTFAGSRFEIRDEGARQASRRNFRKAEVLHLVAVVRQKYRARSVSPEPTVDGRATHPPASRVLEEPLGTRPHHESGTIGCAGNLPSTLRRSSRSGPSPRVDPLAQTR